MQPGTRQLADSLWSCLPGRGITTVFISYRRDDARAVVDRIHERLDATLGQDNVYVDVDSVPLGVDFRRHVEALIAECDVVLVVIGARWLHAADEAGDQRLDDPGDLVRLKIEAALRRDIAVVPVLVDGASMPKQTQLPPSIAELAYRNGSVVRYHPDFNGDMERLIQGALARSSRPTPSTSGGASEHYRTKD